MLLFGCIFSFSVSVSISISVSVSFLGTRISWGRGALTVWSFYLFFSSVLSFFLGAFEGFVYLFLFTFFFRCPFSVFSVAFFMQSTVNFVVFFWRFNSGNFLNAPLCVCMCVGGRERGRSFVAC